MLSRVTLLLIALIIVSTPASAACVVETHINGEINQGTYVTIENALKIADGRGCEALLVILNTPGGLFYPTQKIIELFLNSDVPVIAYVPQGSLSASAGTLILLSANIAAMANGTAIGAATPVASYISKDERNKTINYIAGYVKDIARLRGRNAEIAEKFVTQALTLTAKEALEKGVIDVMADSKAELFRKLDGRAVKVRDGEKTLNFNSYTIIEVKKPVKATLLDIITNPTVASILLIIGIYLLIFGLTSPGVLPETIGTICLILALAGLIPGVIEINTLGIALIILSIIFLIAELHTPTYGILGVASLVCMVLGFLILINEPLMPSAFYDTFRKFVIGIAGGFGAIMTYAVIKISQIRRMESPVGKLTGEIGEVVEFSGKKGYAKVRGEIWRIVSDDDLRKGDEVVVMERDGLTLRVKKRVGDELGGGAEEGDT